MSNLSLQSPREIPYPDDSVDILRLLALLRQKWVFICIVGLLTFSAVMAYTFRSHMTFSSSGRLYLGELSNKHTVAEEIDISGGQGDVSSEIEILSSRSLIAKAVTASGLNVHLTTEGETRPRYWEWRLSERDPELFDAALRRVRATNTHFLSRTRDAEAFMVRFSSPDAFDVLSYGDDGAAQASERLASGRLGEPLEVAGLTLTLTNAPTRSPHTGVPGSSSPSVGEVFQVVVVPVSEVVDNVLNDLTVTAPKGSGGTQPNVVTLGYSNSSPLMAAEFLKALMRVYLEERQEWKTEDATAAETFVSSQLDLMRTSLDKAQKDLAEFRANNRVVVLDSEAEAMIGQISKYEEQRVASRLEVAALADVKRALSSSNPAPEAFMLGEAQDNVLAGLASALSESRRKLTELETRFSPEAPDVINQRAQVEAQMATISSYVNNRLSRARDNLGTLSGVIGTYEEKLKTVPGAELGLAQLTREADVYNALYAFLLKRQQQAAITKASTISKNRILDEPEVPFWEDTPQLRMRLASAPLGLLLGVALVFIGSLFSRNFESSNDVLASVGSTPVFATVPKGLPERRRLKWQSPGVDVLSNQVSFGYLEAFRTLRTNLYLAVPGTHADGKVVLVTSPTPGDGKTTCALSLAWILAADGKKVLVVDADLRKPSHFAIAQLSAGSVDDDHQTTTRDLRAALNGECSWYEAARPIEGTRRSIYSIGVDQPAPAELLSSHNLEPFLREARRDCDYVIIDSPSFPLVSDALLMAPTADVVLSVMRPEHTPRKLANAHMRRLSSASNVYAILVNDAQSQDIYGGVYPAPPRMTQRA